MGLQEIEIAVFVITSTRQQVLGHKVEALYAWLRVGQARGSAVEPLMTCGKVMDQALRHHATSQDGLVQPITE